MLFRSLENRARIYFLPNDPIDTPLVRNTLDAAGPTSQVAALPSTTTSPTFTVNWSGQDDANGSGIASYDLYGSRDGGIFVPYMSGTTLTSMSFTVIPGHTYSFYTVATDNVGHRENLPTAAQASIYVIPLTWHHPVDPLDVNDDDAISPLDALLVINRLNVQPRSTAPLPVPTLALHPAPYLDVTGDNFVTPLDALLVINYLNKRSAGGEGEFERTLLNAGPESEMSGAKPFPIWTTLRLDDPASRIVPSRRDEAILDMLAITVISDQPLKLPSSASLRRPVGEFSSADSKVLTRQDISTHDLDEGLLQFLASDLRRHKKSWRR